MNQIGIVELIRYYGKREFSKKLESKICCWLKSPTISETHWQYQNRCHSCINAHLPTFYFFLFYKHQHCQYLIMLELASSFHLKLKTTLGMKVVSWLWAARLDGFIQPSQWLMRKTPRFFINKSDKSNYCLGWISNWDYISHLKILSWRQKIKIITGTFSRWYLKRFTPAKGKYYWEIWSTSWGPWTMILTAMWK